MFAHFEVCVTDIGDLCTDVSNPETSMHQNNISKLIYPKNTQERKIGLALTISLAFALLVVVEIVSNSLYEYINIRICHFNVFFLVHAGFDVGCASSKP